MPIIFTEKDVKKDLAKALKIAVIGYGSQGHAHALNLKDNGCQVRVALHPESKSIAKAQKDGLMVLTTPEATQWADVIMFCTPDVPMRHIYEQDVAPHLRPNQCLLFAHGFNILYNLITPPKDVDVAMISPKGPGHGLRSEFLSGSGLPALYAAHQDHTGNTQAIALAYAWGIGCASSIILKTTFKEETETDLFGEQAVLCGGIPKLIQTSFETLVAAGYQPEVAYFECLHETKLIVDLLYQGGLDYMNYAISDTAEWGGYKAGPRVINKESQEAMQQVLAEIQDGTFAKNWIRENDTGSKTITQHRQQTPTLQVEQVGKKIRPLIPTTNSKEPPNS